MSLDEVAYPFADLNRLGENDPVVKKADAKERVCVQGADDEVSFSDRKSILLDAN